MVQMDVRWGEGHQPRFPPVNANIKRYRVRNLKFATSKTLVNFMKKMMFLFKNWYFSVQKALIYYTFNKSHLNSFILLVFPHVANFRYVANFTFLTLPYLGFLHPTSINFN